MKIICFGDSVTRGVTYVNGRLRILKKNYPNILSALLKDDEVEVVNKGVFNDNSNNLLRRLEKDVLKENGDIVLIGIGGNDCNFLWQEVAANPEEAHPATVPLDRFVDNLKTIIARVENSGATPVVLTLPPLDPVRYYAYISSLFSSRISEWICKVGGIEHWHGLYNRAVKKVVQESHVKMIDIRSAMKNAGDLSDLISDDGIHPTEQGYSAISKAIYENITALLPQKLVK
ncbi:SGNH/GDSL hydrolase family protein [Bacillus sp. AGMB 02131]|uniref:SGNH/GDSL hydrolase family protein n=1 Tax=Peribacillus faecalis TaxID=2772559 RepID=A0A927D0E1_9BACI|nr:SGNH/GDSL hydrolase family protein [Peribacillus faecalis]MBD3109155.1 SGNH/GDSL hydrolase family protein [Peribacillus faecalis]